MTSATTIGVFDSGVGGLTVLHELRRVMPWADFIYLGDTARVPYGTKSPDTVSQYAVRCSGRLAHEGVDAIVIACNTVSAFALDHVRDHFDIPMAGVIDPGARAAVAASATGRIGVLGTAGTVSSGCYRASILSLRPEAQVFSQACPLFVPLAEEGWITGDVPRLACERYLDRLLKEDIDTLLLGCTHYPLLREVIEQVAGPSVTVIDSASVTAEAVAHMLEGDRIDRTGSCRYLVTDGPTSFQSVGQRFLGSTIEHVEWIDLG